MGHRILGAAAAAFVLAGSSSASAATPNDFFADAAVIAGVPFSDTVDLSGATVEPGEPQFCTFMEHTVWYAFTPPANGVVRFTATGSGFTDTGLSLYQASGPGFPGLSFLGCSPFGGSVTIDAQAGATYYVQTGSVYTLGSLTLVAEGVPPPPNDDFANATAITALPFGDSVDTSVATLEPGEPTPSCAAGYDASKTVWYRFAPAASGSVTASLDTFFATVIAAYAGGSLGGLSEVVCRSSPGPLTFRAEAGTTYQFQVAGLFGSGGPLGFHLAATPPPVAGFFFYPFDPSVFDVVQFNDASSDPGGAGFLPPAWNFGDGSTATGFNVTHRYGVDGDYLVQLDVATADGRTASATQTVPVRTHDVGIARLSAPQSANAGQTRSISVDVRNTRYPEVVDVHLYRSTPAGFEIVGTSRQSVPVRQGNRTTRFDFNYTFTSDDAKVGKVTFKADAILVNARDALPADNEAISSPPTKVNR